QFNFGQNNNHIITSGSADADTIESYIASGGNVYMEGGDVWYYDPMIMGGHNFGPTFGINAIADGISGGEFNNILGFNISAGQNFAYNTGTDNYPDHIEPTGSGLLIHSNDSPNDTSDFDCGVANELAGRTIGVSFEFGELIDSFPPSTKVDLMSRYIDFFANQPPVISHIPIPTGQADQNILVEAIITDDVGIAKTILYYRRGGEQNFTMVSMDSIGSNFNAVIPASEVNSRGVEYFITASDVSGHEVREPSSDFISIRVDVPTPGVTNPNPQPSGSEQNAYRLISVPLDINNKSPQSVLVDDLGEYE
ncbi:MAG: hypothetical protein GWN00_07415, partial [Aliifodinibius sp.]|nr:hypothetical protein [Fodinibius sp.]NIV11065.1 hypothetical protein [Fodinibius sp.]NIY24644.1 hypothetical protein [Fodinibius sp.]